LEVKGAISRGEVGTEHTIIRVSCATALKVELLAVDKAMDPGLVVEGGRHTGHGGTLHGENKGGVGRH
jgi:hypothetical protein